MPYQTLLPDTLLIGGADIQLLTGVYLEDLAFLLAPGLRRGGNDVIPGRRGQLGAGKQLDAYGFTVPVTVTAQAEDGTESQDLREARTQMLTNLAGLAAVVLAGTDGQIPLTRRLTNGAGYDQHTANGEFVSGLTPAAGDVIASELSLQFLNLDGAWTPDGGTSWLVP